MVYFYGILPIMGRQKISKINSLLQAWPKNTVAVYLWLDKKGISRKLAEQYQKSGWVKSIGRGAVIRAGDEISWEGGLYAIQTQLGQHIHVGGNTALELHGYAHQVPARQTVKLFAAAEEKLPAWFRKHSWRQDIAILATNLFSTSENLGITKKQYADFAIKISSPERAIMELLYQVPENYPYGEAKLLMEGLATLRPDLVQKLLEHCSSIKVKRLFMILAEDFDFSWLKKLKSAHVDFGSGKRSLIKGGKLHPKYLITVPIETENSH